MAARHDVTLSCRGVVCIIHRNVMFCLLIGVLGFSWVKRYKEGEYGGPCALYYETYILCYVYYVHLIVNTVKYNLSSFKYLLYI